MIESPARPLQLTQQLFQLMVRFQVGDQQYAMASHHIQEILPAVDLYPIDSPARTWLDCSTITAE
jgi:chemotaxis signal transduction protein